MSSRSLKACCTVPRRSCLTSTLSAVRGLVDCENDDGLFILPQVPRRRGISPRTLPMVFTYKVCPSCCWLSAVCKRLQVLLPLWLQPLPSPAWCRRIILISQAFAPPYFYPSLLCSLDFQSSLDQLLGHLSFSVPLHFLSTFAC